MTTPIQGFFLSGVVSKEKAGDVLAALYDANAVNMQMDPIYAGKPQANTPKQASNGHVQAAPKYGTAIKFAMAAIQQAGTISREELRKLLDDAGYIGKHVSTPLRTLIEQGRIEKIGLGLYRAVSGVTVATAPKEAQPYPQEERIVSAMRGQGDVTRGWIRHNANIQKNSLGPIMKRLVDRGLIKKTGRSLYCFIK